MPLPEPDIQDLQNRTNLEYLDRAIRGLLDGMVPAGVFAPFGGTVAPPGWLICDGSSILRADYPRLFTAIGTRYGSVDGTHFNLPPAPERAVYGLTNPTDTPTTDGNTLGNRGPDHKLTTGEMPKHTHPQQSDTVVANGSAHWAYPSTSPFADLSRGGVTGQAGNDEPHNHGYIEANFIIKT